MAELNQNKKSKYPVKCENLFLIGNTVAYASKELFKSVLQNCCTKSTRKFPKKVAHASFLQCSAYIYLGQDGCLRNKGKGKKHGKYGSIMPPHIFPWKP